MLENVYTSIEAAREEIWRRWNDVYLRRKVEAFVGHVPEPLIREPRAILNRDIATPDNEFGEFVRRAHRLGLSPLVPEYLEDKFVGINPDKLALAKMPIYTGRDKNGNSTYRYRNVIDYAKCDGMKFYDIKTLWGEPLASFHHRLLRLIYPDVEVFDNSMWLNSKGYSARDFYPYELSLYICYGVLFEDFISCGAERIFCAQIVKPAIEKLIDIFGLKPLIVALVSKKTSEDEFVDDIYWYSYPPCLEDEITRFLPLNPKDNSHTGLAEEIAKERVL